LLSQDYCIFKLSLRVVGGQTKTSHRCRVIDGRNSQSNIFLA